MNAKWLRPSLLLGSFFLFTVTWQSCDDGITTPARLEQETPITRHTSPDYFSPTAKQLVMNIFYEPEAEPTVGTLSNNDPVWSIIKKNTDTLMQATEGGNGPSLSIPGTEVNPNGDIAGFTKLMDQNKEGWTIQEIFNLAVDEGKNVPNTPEAPAFYVFYLKGYIKDTEGNLQKSVLGVSLSIIRNDTEQPTPVIALFKDVINNAASGAFSITTNKLALIEQTTLSHEMGHSLGLVNMAGGIPMTGSHEDPNHPRHCRHQDCLMYWANESSSSQAMQDFLDGTVTIIGYCRDCLADASAYRAQLSAR